MKINFIGFNLIRSGGMKVIFEYANRLSLRGHDVYFYYPWNEYVFDKPDDSFFYLKRYLKSAKNYLRKANVVNIHKYSFQIKRVPYINNYFLRDADVTIATTWPTAYSVDKLSSKKGRKIYFIQGYETWNSDITKVDKSYYLQLCKITNSHYLRDLFYKKFNADCKVILNGIDYDLFCNETKIYNEIKTITFVDNALVQKGANEAIKVVDKLHHSYQNTKFLCFGFEAYHDIPNFVNFIKNPDEHTIANIYKKTDIFLYTSLYEGFALPPAEAMACKCAVVTTRVGAVPEYSKHMESAIHVEPGNIDELFNGVCYLLNNDKEIMRISENAYEYIRQILNWDESVEKFERFIFQAN